MKFIHESTHQVFNLDLVQRDVVVREYNPSAQLDPPSSARASTTWCSTSTSAPRSGTSTPWTSPSTPTWTSTSTATSCTAWSGTSRRRTRRTAGAISTRESFAFTRRTRAEDFTTRLAKVSEDSYTVDGRRQLQVRPGDHARDVLGHPILRDYTLRVPNPGVMAIKVAANDVHAFDTQKLTSIEVEIGYGDPGKGSRGRREGHPHQDGPRSTTAGRSTRPGTGRTGTGSPT